MGRVRAMEFASLVEDGSISIDSALEYHLRHNHYPPIPSVFIPIAKKALEIAREALEHHDYERFDETLVSPTTGKKATIRHIIEVMHLEDFI